MVYQVWVLILASAQLLSLPVLCFLAFFYQPSGQLEQWSIKWGDFSANGQSLVLALGVLLFLGGLITLRMASTHKISRIRSVFSLYVPKETLDRLLDEDAQKTSNTQTEKKSRAFYYGLLGTRIGKVQILGFILAIIFLFMQLARINSFF